MINRYNAGDGMSRNEPGRKTMMQRTSWIVLAALCLFCAGCASDTDEDRMREGAQQAPFHLDSEQVSLTPQQLSCGVEKDLWDAPESGAGRSIAHIRQTARDLGFTDDVSIGDTGFIFPYTQIRGDFMLGFDSMVEEKDGPSDGTKTVQAKVRVKVPHDCFMAGLPIMGIQKGQFRQNAPVTLVFAVNGDSWRLDHFVH
jgi:hypothetical protein